MHVAPQMIMMPQTSPRVPGYTLLNLALLRSAMIYLTKDCH